MQLKIGEKDRVKNNKKIMKTGIKSQLNEWMKKGTNIVKK